MSIFSRHVIKSLALATAFITLILTGIVILAQSIKFLELIIESGASGSTYLTLLFLALPRFIEVILPLALFGATLFIYSKMMNDHEISVMKNAGYSPLQISKPAFVLSLIVFILMLILTTWVTPHFLAKLQALKHVIRAEFSSLIFKEGIFSTTDNNVTIYIQEKDGPYALKGIVVYDNRKENKSPVLITAESGTFSDSEDEQKIIVYNGIRETFDRKTKNISRLNFSQYTLTIPYQSSPLTQRWKEPNERTLFELLNPDLKNNIDRDFLNELFLEAHRRISTPLMGLSFSFIALAGLLKAEKKRNGYTTRISLLVISVIILQSAFLGIFNVAKTHLVIGIISMYMLAIIPTILALLWLSPLSDNIIFNRPKLRSEAA